MPPRSRHVGLQLVSVLALLGFAVTATFADPSEAAFLAEGSGAASSQADVLGEGVAPTLILDGRDLAVEWAAATIGGAPVDGYTIRRYGDSGEVHAVPEDCFAGETTCVDRAVPPGTWEYTVTPAKGSWTGAESQASDAVTVPPPAITLTSSSSVTSLPATVTAEVTGLVEGAALSYRLDDPVDGAELAGTPEAVPAGGAVAVAVNLPGDTAHGMRRIHVIAEYESAGGPETDVTWVDVDVAGEPFGPVSLELANGSSGVTGRIDANDVVTVAFNRPLAVDTVCSAWNQNDTGQNLTSGVIVTVTRNGAGPGRDRLDVTAAGCADGLAFGRIDLGANFVRNGNTVTWGTQDSPSSQVHYDPATYTLRVVLGPQTTGNVQRLNVVPSSTAVYEPDERLRDTEGDAVTGTASSSGTQF
jgi:hypothetical protein